MNEWELNAQTIGDGGNDPRVFLSLAIAVKVATDAVVYARRYLVSAIGVEVSTAARLDGVFRMVAALKVRTVITADATRYYAKYLTAALRVNVVDTFAVVAHRHLAAAIAVATPVTSILFRGKPLAAAITVEITTTATITELGRAAHASRTMKLLADNRTMKVH